MTNCSTSLPMFRSNEDSAVHATEAWPCRPWPMPSIRMALGDTRPEMRSRGCVLVDATSTHRSGYDVAIGVIYKPTIRCAVPKTTAAHVSLDALHGSHFPTTRSLFPPNRATDAAIARGGMSTLCPSANCLAEFAKLLVAVEVPDDAADDVRAHLMFLYTDRQVVVCNLRGVLKATRPTDATECKEEWSVFWPACFALPMCHAAVSAKTCRLQTTEDATQDFCSKRPAEPASC